VQGTDPGGSIVLKGVALNVSRETMRREGAVFQGRAKAAVSRERRRFEAERRQFRSAGKTQRKKGKSGKQANGIFLKPEIHSFGKKAVKGKL